MTKYYNAGDAIVGERIASRFRKINIYSGVINKGVLGFRCFRAKLRGNVFCVIDKCLEISILNSIKKTGIHFDNGDSLKGEQILTEFSKGRKHSLTQGSSSHRIQTTVFENNVYCVIDLPFESVRNP